MKEQVNAPQGIPIEGVVHALGSLSATAAHPEGALIEAPLVTQKVALYPDTALSKKDYLQQYEQWISGSPAESVKTGIAHIAMQPEDLAVLNSTDAFYTTLHTADILSHATHSARLLTPAEVKLVQKYAHLFLAVVRKDGQRSGIGEPHFKDLVIQYGNFTPHTAGLANGGDWHVDTHQEPTIRYVVSFGAAGSTLFAEGTLEPHTVTWLGFLRDPVAIKENTAWSITRPVPGTVTRFPSRFGVHSTPENGGNRLFFSASIAPAYTPR